MIVKGGFKTRQRIEVIDGVPVPEEIHVDATDESWPFDVKMLVGLSKGRMKVRSISFHVHEGKDVESADLRIPVLKILRTGVLSALATLSALTGQNLARVKDEGPTENSLRVVAAIYRLAFLSGHAPTKTVAEVLGLSRATAARWVQKARAAGSLGPAKERRAGETKPKKTKPKKTKPKSR